MDSDPCRLSAHDVALSKQHKSISASDVLRALEMIEFGDLVDPLQNELQSILSLFVSFGVSFRTVYRDTAKGDKNRKIAVDRSSVSNTNKGKAKEGEGISSASASRPKGKAKATLPPPFTTMPLQAVPSSISHMTEDVEMSVRAVENEEMGEGEGGGDDVPEYAEEVDEPPIPDYDTEEELEPEYDESEELKKDAAGFDDAQPGDDSQM